jgi:hypothetical protein
MSEYDDELALRDEFARWRAEARYTLPRRDVARVRAAARRRRVTRVIVTGVCASALLGAPATAWAVDWHNFREVVPSGTR